MEKNTQDVFHPFDRYQISRVIKTLPNGRANSWKGKGKQDESEVVLKIYPGVLTEEASKAWLARDWKRWAKLFELIPEEQTMFAVREWIEGTSLSDATRRRTNYPGTVYTLRLFGEISDALDRLHEKGEIHGQIKSTNIFLRGDSVCITDPVIHDPLKKEDPGATMDVTETIAGAIHYLNPEVLQNKKQTTASDIYSLGCVLYEWLTERVPFRGDNPILLCYQHLSSEPAPIEKYLPDVDPELAKIVMKMLSKKPEDRFQTASELRDVLFKDIPDKKDEPLETLMLLAEGERKPIANPLAAGETVILHPEDIRRAREIMAESPGLSLDEVRKKILRAQGDPMENIRIPNMAMDMSGMEALKTYKPKEKPKEKKKTDEDTDVFGLDVKKIKETMEVDERALAEAVRRSSGENRIPMNRRSSSLIEQLHEGTHKEEADFRIPFYIVCAYAILVTLILLVKIIVG